MRELISFGRAMNRRRFITTQPSLLFRAAAGFSSHCIHPGHTTGISEEEVLLYNSGCHCTLNYLTGVWTRGTFVCPHRQNIYDRVAPIFPCFHVCLCVYIFTLVSTSQNNFRFTGGSEPCLPPAPKCHGVGCPCPSHARYRVCMMWSTIMWIIHCLYCSMWCSNKYINIWLQGASITMTSCSAINLMWESGRFRSSAMLLNIHETKYIYTWVHVQCTQVKSEYRYEYTYTAKSWVRVPGVHSF